MKVKDTGGERTLAPEGIHEGRICWIADLGTQETKFGDKRQLYIAWELVDETHVWDDERGEETFVMGKSYTFSMGSKSNLYRDIKSWLGRTPEVDEDGFEMADLLGTAGQVQVEHNEGYANIVGLMSLSKKQSKNVQEGMQDEIIFSLEPEEFDIEELALLPEWMQNKICETEEYEIAVEETEGRKAKKGKRVAKKVVDDEEEEEAPKPRRSKRVKKAPEPEDDDLPFDDEEEEEEAPKPRRRRRK